MFGRVYFLPQYVCVFCVCNSEIIMNIYIFVMKLDVANHFQYIFHEFDFESTL